MLFYRRLLLLSIILIHTLYAENSISLNLNNKDIEINSIIDLNHFMDYYSDTDYLIDINYLYSDGSTMASAGIYGKNLFPGVEGLSLSLGMQSTFAKDFIALPFVLKSDYLLPQIELIPVSLNLSFLYAPHIMSFSDASQYKEIRSELDLEIISNIHLFAGYRYIQTQYETIKKTFNKTSYAGMKISF